MRLQSISSEGMRLLIAQPASDISELLGEIGAATDLLKALSHETRLIVLCQLAEGEKSVTELEQLLQLRQPALSQQLARLRDEGVVATRRKGRHIYYSLASHAVREVILALHRSFCTMKRAS